MRENNECRSSDMSSGYMARHPIGGITRNMREQSVFKLEQPKRSYIHTVSSEIRPLPSSRTTSSYPEPRTRCIIFSNVIKAHPVSCIAAVHNINHYELVDPD